MTTYNPDQFFQKNPDTSKSDEISRTIAEVFSRHTLEQKGVVSSALAIHLIRGDVYASRFHSKLMREIVDLCIDYSISKGGRGRSDLVKVIQSMMFATGGEEGKKAGIVRRLFGVGGI